MSTGSVNGASGSSSSSGSSSTAADRYSQLGVNDFLKMLVAELQNQDPLSPTDSSQILQQVSQIRDIVSSDKLTSTLGSLNLSDSMATASNLLSRTITGVDQNQQSVTGQVDKIAVQDGTVLLYVGDHQIDLSNVSSIAAGASATSG